MQGRVEHKREMELSLQQKLEDKPKILKDYYYSLRENSHTTKKRYIYNVIRFLNYYNGNDIDKKTKIDFNLITSTDINSYIEDINYIEEDGELKELSAATKACIYSSLSSFFDFLVNQSVIDISPFVKNKIKRPKVQENDIVFLTPEEIKEVENNIMRGVGNKTSVSKQKDWKYRDYLLFRIPAVSGIRVTALNEINLSDINLRDGFIRITEKGNIDTKAYLDEKTIIFIRLWLEEREKLLNGKEEKSLFISNRRERMTVRSIENIIDKYTESIKDKKITPHKLRSTCGTNLYQETKDIYLVSKVLNHKTTAPTRRYAKVFEEDRKDAVNVLASIYK